MMRLLSVLVLFIVMASCRSTKKIQTAINKRDTTQMVHTSVKEDTTNFIRSTLQQLASNKIEFNTFAAKINVDYRDADERNYNLTAFVRMYKDSVIWISVNSILGEALRAYITPDSVKILDKRDKKYIARSLDYLQNVTSLPFDFKTLQDVIVGNPAFLDSNVTSYSRGNNLLNIVSLNNFFKSVTTLEDSTKLLQRTKIDEESTLNNRTAEFTYAQYDRSSGVNFPTLRKITVVGKGHLDIGLEFKKYDFNPASISTPFTIPKNYKKA